MSLTIIIIIAAVIIAVFATFAGLALTGGISEKKRQR